MFRLLLRDMHSKYLFSPRSVEEEDLLLSFQDLSVKANYTFYS